MIVRPMHPSEEPAVRALHAVSHPNAEAPSAPWFFAYPTLVAVDQDGGILGFAQYGMNLDPRVGLAIYLLDTCVEWHARGRGIAKKLMTARLDIGRQLGAVLAVGATTPDNAPMLSILATFGFGETPSTPTAFTLPLKDQ